MLTAEKCQLLRIEQKDFQVLWQNCKHMMQETLLTPNIPKQKVDNRLIKSHSKDIEETETNPALPICAVSNKLFSFF